MPIRLGMAQAAVMGEAPARDGEDEGRCQKQQRHRVSGAFAKVSGQPGLAYHRIVIALDGDDGGARQLAFAIGEGG